MADFTMKRGDSWPPIDAVLSDQDGPINLTTASNVKLLFKTTGAGATTFTRTCTITGAAGGAVRYTWTSGDAATGPTSVVNTFNIEWEITWSDSSVTTVPNEGYASFAVEADLG